MKNLVIILLGTYAWEYTHWLGNHGSGMVGEYWSQAYVGAKLEC